MCFYHGDYDWYAELQENDSYIIKNLPITCNECLIKVQVGETIHHIYLQQHEECNICYSGECDCPFTVISGEEPERNCCQCKYPEFGETFDWYCCDNCHKFLEAIQTSETEAGCKGNSTRPALGTMVEELREGGKEEVERYIKKLESLYPELITNGYLERILGEIFKE